jgi:prepilin-type N-terminal cleavage/methylation domain-containing protein
MQRRRGFTLIEMMVSMALVLFIMTILSQAFVAGLEAFRQLKSIGDMEERMRAATTVLRNDLNANHFDLAHPALHDVAFFSTSNADMGPPSAGFFRVQHGSPIWPAGTQGVANTWEGYDGDGIPSARVTDHILHFTSMLPGTSRDTYFVTSIFDPNPITTVTPALPAYGSPLHYSQNPPPPDGRFPDGRFQDFGTYTNTSAEIAYFLQPNGDNAQGTPLFSLYRRQRLLVTDPTINPTPVNDPSSLKDTLYAGVSSTNWIAGSAPPPQQPIHFNSTADITVPERRFALNPTPLSAGMTYADPVTGVTTTGPGYQPLGTGSDILLTDVISFEVSLLINDTRPAGGTAPPTGYDPFVDLWDSEALSQPNNANDPMPPYPGPALPSLVGGPPNTNANPLIQTLPIPAPPAAPLTRAPMPARFFDTWSSVNSGGYDYSQWNNPSPPNPNPATVLCLRPTISAIRITIRVWDKKTQNTRQVTLIQAM